MFKQKSKIAVSTSRSVSDSVGQRKSNSRQGVGIIDNRSSTLLRMKSSGSDKIAPPVYQLVKTDSGIPTNVNSFFEGKGYTYHQFKQKNWDLIAQAHQIAHTSMPATSGAEYTIDARTGDELIKLLGPNWQPYKGHQMSEKERRKVENRKKPSRNSVTERQKKDSEGKTIREYKTHDKAKGKENSGVSPLYYLPNSNQLYKDSEPVVSDSTLNEDESVVSDSTLNKEGDSVAIDSTLGKEDEK